jgi:hypothetical protein
MNFEAIAQLVNDDEDLMNWKQGEGVCVICTCLILFSFLSITSL